MNILKIKKKKVKNIRMNKNQKLFIAAFLIVIIFTLIPGKLTLWIAAVVVSLISAVFNHYIFKHEFFELTDLQRFIISCTISGTLGFIIGYALGEKLKTHWFFHDL